MSLQNNGSIIIETTEDIGQINSTSVRVSNIIEVETWEWNIVGLKATTNDLNIVVDAPDNPISIIVEPNDLFLTVTYVPDGNLFPIDFIEYKDSDNVGVSRAVGVNAWNNVPLDTPNIIHMREDFRSQYEWRLDAVATGISELTQMIVQEIGSYFINVEANYDLSRNILLSRISGEE